MNRCEQSRGGNFGSCVGGNQIVQVIRFIRVPQNASAWDNDLGIKYDPVAMRMRSHPSMVRPEKVGALANAASGICRSAQSHMGTIRVDGVMPLRL